MKLKKFIDKFIEPNSLVRLWFESDEGHTLIIPPIMEWQLIKDNSKFLSYSVSGVTDILVHDHYKEAINIVLKYPTYKQSKKRLLNGTNQ